MVRIKYCKLRTTCKHVPRNPDTAPLIYIFMLMFILKERG